MLDLRNDRGLVDDGSLKTAFADHAIEGGRERKAGAAIVEIAAHETF